MIDLDEIKTRISKGEQIEDIIKQISWQEFESFVSKIFTEHDFDVFQNFRFKANKRYEIDILSVSNNIVFAVDCKQWSRGRYKKTALKKSITEQTKRVKELKKVLVGENLRVIPLIVTLFEEDIVEHKKVWIVPIWKLNEFLLNLSSYI